MMILPDPAVAPFTSVAYPVNTPAVPGSAFASLLAAELETAAVPVASAEVAVDLEEVEQPASPAGWQLLIGTSLIAWAAPVPPTSASSADPPAGPDPLLPAASGLLPNTPAVPFQAPVQPSVGESGQPRSESGSLLVGQPQQDSTTSPGQPDPALATQSGEPTGNVDVHLPDMEREGGTNQPANQPLTTARSVTKQAGSGTSRSQTGEILSFGKLLPEQFHQPGDAGRSGVLVTPGLAAPPLSKAAGQPVNNNQSLSDHPGQPINPVLPQPGKPGVTLPASRPVQVQPGEPAPPVQFLTEAGKRDGGEKSFQFAPAIELAPELHLIREQPARPGEAHPGSLARQVGRGIANLIHSGQVSVRLQLHPQDLGRIDLRLTSGPGGVQVVITPEQSATGLLLEQNLSHLRQSMVDAGVQLNGLSVGHESASGRHPSGSFGRFQPQPRVPVPDQPTRIVELAAGISTGISLAGSSAFDYRI